MHFYNVIFRIDFFADDNYKGAIYHNGYTCYDNLTLSAPGIQIALDNALDALEDLNMNADISILTLQRI